MVERRICSRQRFRRGEISIFRWLRRASLAAIGIAIVGRIIAATIILLLASSTALAYRVPFGSVLAGVASVQGNNLRPYLAVPPLLRSERLLRHTQNYGIPTDWMEMPADKAEPSQILGGKIRALEFTSFTGDFAGATPMILMPAADPASSPEVHAKADGGDGWPHFGFDNPDDRDSLKTPQRVTVAAGAVGSGTLIVNWDNEDGAGGYHVLVTDTADPPNILSEETVTANEATIEGLPPHIAVRVTVTVCNEAGDASEASQPVTTMVP